MQIRYFLRPALFFLGILLAIAGSVCSATAQSTPATAAPANPYLVTIDFKGGPLSKLIAGLNANRATPYTLINTMTGFDPEVPPFAVHQQPFPAVMTAVSALIRPQGGVIQSLTENLALLQARDDRKETSFVAFQLEMQLNRLSLDEIISAIRSAYAFAAPEEKPDALRFKFHPGTKILFIAGPQRNIDSIVRPVIQSLPFGPPIPPATPTPQK